jgi:hypothetical protein
MPTFQSVDVSLSTDSTGTFTFSFDDPIDQVQMTVKNPQTGQDSAIIGGTCDVTGTKQVTGRLWRSGASFTAKPAASESVGVSLLGIKN